MQIWRPVSPEICRGSGAGWSPRVQRCCPGPKAGGLPSREGPSPSVTADWTRPHTAEGCLLDSSHPFNCKRIQKHLRRNTQNDMWPHIWAPHRDHPGGARAGQRRQTRPPARPAQGCRRSSLKRGTWTFSGKNQNEEWSLPRSQEAPLNPFPASCRNQTGMRGFLFLTAELPLVRANALWVLLGRSIL